MPRSSGSVPWNWREKTMAGGDATTPGKLYVVDGNVRQCPVGATTVSQMLSALGGSAATTYDPQARIDRPKPGVNPLDQV
jgi:hypothetical protein